MAFKRTTPEQDALIVEEYLSGVSALRIATSIGKSHHLVLDRLREAGVPIRQKERVPPQRIRVLPEHEATLKAIVDGLMLGDGAMQRSGRLDLSQCLRREAWLHDVSARLTIIGVRNRIISRPPSKGAGVLRKGVPRTIQGKGSSLLYTAIYEEFRVQRARWYPDGKKRVPADVDLSPLSVALWFAGDGSCTKTGGLNFHTNGFTAEEVDFLRERIKDTIGLSSLRHGDVETGPKITICRRDESVRLAGYIQDHLHPCFAYKLKHVRPAIPRGHAVRRLTEAQVSEIRSRYKPGNATALGHEFGVSNVTITNIVQGRIYKDSLTDTPPQPDPMSGRPNRKLTNEQVLEIRRRYKAEQGAALAREFGVEPSTIHRIASGRSYKWLPIEDDPLDIVPVQPTPEDA